MAMQDDIDLMPEFIGKNVSETSTQELLETVKYLEDFVKKNESIIRRLRNGNHSSIISKKEILKELKRRRELK